MSLSVYNKKRNFKVTSEPVGKEKTAKGLLRFVVQKHDASHLHYDFRLEMEGVLKSWAVPKGPSLNPADKRLAMAVEDHPFDYKNFEGIIPAGNYGGGTVIVWDEGTYQLVEGESLSKKEQEKQLLKQLQEGSLKIILQGKKLCGEFALFLMKGRGDRSWILMKKKDEFATAKNILLHDASVKSGKTLAEIATENGTVLNHPENEKVKEKQKTKAPQLLPQQKEGTKKASSPAKAERKTSSEKKMVSTVSKIKTSGHQINATAGNEQTMIIDKHELTLTNLNKLYWKKEKFSKGDTLDYYLQAAPYILPYMMGRPQSLNRHPNGIEGTSFYQKDMQGKLPEWMDTHKDFSESTGKTVAYLVCNNEATLIYMANLGCIEMNPWHSQSLTWQNPDWCLIDLDPDTTNSFNQVMETALVTKNILDSIGADSYVKTSGSTGLHIYIPLGAQYTFDQSKQLAELVANLVHQQLPDTTSVERTPAKRKGKIYLDYLQNRETQTVAAPYSLRPKKGMPVSTPLHWSELKKGLKATTYTAKNIFDRLKTEGNLFAPVLGKGINLKKVLANLTAQVK